MCHCLRVEKAGDVMQYTGLSPDEEALAKAAKLVSPISNFELCFRFDTFFACVND